MNPLVVVVLVVVCSLFSTWVGWRNGVRAERDRYSEGTDR